MDPREALCQAFGVLITLPCLCVSKLLLVALPIAQIAIGVSYLKECPQQHYIPMYVLVSGVFSIVLGLLTCLPFNQREQTGSVCLDCLCLLWNGLVSVFMFCWFISGSVWIYSIYPPNYNATVIGEPYCNKTLYLFAFWTTTLVYILLAVLLVAAICCPICFYICSAIKGSRSAVPPDET